MALVTTLKPEEAVILDGPHTVQVINGGKVPCRLVIKKVMTPKPSNCESQKERSHGKSIK